MTNPISKAEQGKHEDDKYYSQGEAEYEFKNRGKRYTFYQKLRESVRQMADFQKDILAYPESKTKRWPRTVVEEFTYGKFKWRLSLRRFKL